MPRSAIGLSAGLVVLAAGLVGVSLRREPVAEFAVTPVRPAEAGEGLVGPRRITIDASDPDRWVGFDFSRGSAVPVAGTEWDLAFRRFNVLVNGGSRFAGDAAVVALDGVAFADLRVAPPGGWVQPESDGRDSANAAIARWYDYGFVSHRLVPRPVTYAIRTADGRYAKLRFLSYYCPGAAAGCVTFQYTYQGDGSRVLAEAVRGASSR